jgi:hypothetical protein
MTRTQRPRPRRRTSVLTGSFGSRECFATEEDWQEYQDVLARLQMIALGHVMDGEERRPAQGFRMTPAHQPNKRKRAFERQAKETA